MIYEWRPSPDYRNYGDALGEIVVEALKNGLSSERDTLDNSEIMYFPIGSVIQDVYIESTLNLGMTPIFVGCGWDGKELTPELAKQAKYLGCRGPETKAALERAGVSNIPVYGDTAYVALDYLNIAVEKTYSTLLIPHVGSEDYDLKASQAEHLMLPRVVTRQDIVDMASCIAGASFILSYAMHACITAHAYRVPFAPYATEENKKNGLSKKWYDWFASIGVNAPQVELCSTLEEGLDWYERVFVPSAT